MTATESTTDGAGAPGDWRTEGGGKGLVVRWDEGGNFGVVIPNDPLTVERRKCALGVLAAERRAEWDALRESLPHRSEVRPDPSQQALRQWQDLSLGRRCRPELNLHPMTGDRYLWSLAGMLAELGPRMELMRQEMTARPEQYGGRAWDRAVWRSCAAAVLVPNEAEQSLAAWLSWIAGRGTPNGDAAMQHVLQGLPLWCARSRWVFSLWVVRPYFVDLED